MKSLSRVIELVCETVSWDILRATENCPGNTSMSTVLTFYFLPKFSNIDGHTKILKNKNILSLSDFDLKQWVNLNVLEKKKKADVNLPTTKFFWFFCIRKIIKIFGIYINSLNINIQHDLNLMIVQNCS